MQRFWLAGVVAAVAALVVAAVVVALAGKEKELEAGTPGRAVQDFIRMAEKGDFGAVHAALGADLQSSCTVDALATASPRLFRDIRDSRVTLEGTQIFDETAVVTTKFTTLRSGGPFGSSEYSQTQTYALEQEDGEWRFAQLPWPVRSCGPRSAIEPPVRVPEAPSVPAPESIATGTTTEAKR